METLETKKVPLSTNVDVELAAEMRRLADEGNRSVSREVAAAIRGVIAERLAL